METIGITRRPLSHGNSSSTVNSSSSSSANELVMTSLLGTILTSMGLLGIVGNVYVLMVMNLSRKFTGSMYLYIMNLALSDLIYLSTIPFVLCTYFLKDWYFGHVGCRIIFSLDFLTMHASIFILTVMSTERYLAVVKPLDTFGRNRNYRKTIMCLVWLVSFLLALPTMIMIDRRQIVNNGATKYICHPTWPPNVYKVYFTVLFNTSVLAPGLVIGFMYTRLAQTYWVSQFKEVRQSPKQKILYMIFGIVLAYCVCFLPFWLWQLFTLYWQESIKLSPKTVAYVNLLVTCFAYSNSCVNPFLYTLLSKNYKDYSRNRQKRMVEFTRRHRGPPSQPSASSGTNHYIDNPTVTKLERPGECGPENSGNRTTDPKVPHNIQIPRT